MEEEKDSWGAFAADVETVLDRIERYPAGNVGIFHEEKLIGKCIWQPVMKIYNDWHQNVSRNNLNLSRRFWNQRDAYVINFDVRPSYRGTGAADELMKFTIDSMRQDGIQTLYLGGRNVAQNSTFYQRHLTPMRTIDNYWPEDKESAGKGILYKRDIL